MCKSTALMKVDTREIILLYSISVMKSMSLEMSISVDLLPVLMEVQINCGFRHF